MDGLQPRFVRSLDWAVTTGNGCSSAGVDCAADPFDGLEHEDSPYDGIGDAGLSKPDQLEGFGWGLLAHEQAHSWDGKYRRPAELYSKPDYQGPERTSMRWVYEGLNEYLGMLLAARAGFNDTAYMRDLPGVVASRLASRLGVEYL